MVTDNWARNVTFGARAHERPSSVDEVRALVARTDRVKVLGSGHSFNGIADTTGTQLSLAGLPPLIDIDPGARQVRISAGLAYGDIAPQLHAAGFALPNLASLPHITVAGACATGTHGSGDHNGNLATAVVGIEMVTGSGDVVTIKRGDDGFDGTVVALGRLGVITAMTLDLVPTYDITQYVYEDLPDEQLDADFDAIFAGGYSVSVFTDLLHNQTWCKRLATDPPPGPTWFEAHAALQQLNPVPGRPAESGTPQLGVPGPWHERLPHVRWDFPAGDGSELQSEYLLPRQHAVAALEVLRGLRDQIAPLLYVAEIRTVAADELWLSPMYRRPTVGFHFTWTSDAAAVAPVITAIEGALAPFDPRPHWGKVFSQAVHYERMADFVRLVETYDPNGTFGNEFVDGLVAQ